MKTLPSLALLLQGSTSTGWPLEETYGGFGSVFLTEGGQGVHLVAELPPSLPFPKELYQLFSVTRPFNIKSAFALILTQIPQATSSTTSLYSNPGENCSSSRKIIWGTLKNDEKNILTRE